VAGQPQGGNLGTYPLDHAASLPPFSGTRACRCNARASTTLWETATAQVPRARPTSCCDRAPAPPPVPRLQAESERDAASLGCHTGASPYRDGARGGWGGMDM
jgi:hypothetical protein